MKRTNIIIALFAVLTLTAQTALAKGKIVVWEHPATAENRNIEGYFGPLLEITRVEMTDQETRVSMHIAERPEFGLRFAKETYLLADGKRYAMRSCDGIELDKQVFLTNHGQADIVFHFEPLPHATKNFDFIEGDGEGFRLLGVESVATRAQRLFSSNWRNEQTGDWEIGFYNDFAIYDCQYWNYKQRIQKGDKYTFVLENDGGEIPVSVDKNKNGKRKMTIDGKKMTYSFISTITLPDYPQKDENATIRDTHYQTDTVTLVGWLKNMPKAMKEKKEYEVFYQNIFNDEQVSSSGKMDSLGRFMVKIPLLNSSEVACDWGRTFIHTLFESGETYFLLYDYESGQKLFMGKNSRLQNETLNYPIEWIHGYDDYENKMDSTQAIAFLDMMKHRKAELMKELQNSETLHPNLSTRYINYLTGLYNTSEGRELMQARFYTKDRFVPQSWLDYAGSEHWKKRSRPYTLYGHFGTFTRDYINQLMMDRFSVNARGLVITLNNDFYPDVLRHHRDVGDLQITDEELSLIKQCAHLKKQALISQIKGTEEHKIIEEMDIMKRYNAIMKREDINKAFEEEDWSLAHFYRLQQILDSVGCDPDLKSILIANELFELFDQNRKSLSEPMMKYVEEHVQMAAAKAFLQAEQDKYVALEKGNLANAASLRPSSDVEGMTDGEKILRKLIEPFKGRLVYIDIWGTWCGPCKEGLSHAKELKEALKDHDIVYLYLANRSPEETWKNVIKQYQLTGENSVHYNLPVEQQSAIEHYLQVNSFPTYKLVDREGNIHDLDWRRFNNRNLKEFEKEISKYDK